MFRLGFLACALLASATSFARPMVIHQSQSLQPPPGYYFFGYEVAIDGDWAIIIAATRSATPTSPQETHDALLYHLVNGKWTFDRTLVHRVSTTYPQNPLIYFKSVAMNNGLAAIGSDPTRIFKRTNNTWTEIAHPFTATEGHPDWVSDDLIWDGNTLLAARSVCSYPPDPTWGALISTLNADGSWSPLERLSSGDTYCLQQPIRWGFSGNTVVAGTLSNDYEQVGNQLRIFRRSGTTWTPTAAINGVNDQADVRGDEIFYLSRPDVATGVFRNDDSPTVVDKIRTVSASFGDSWSAWGFAHTNDLFVQQGDVFRKNVAGKYEHVAILKPRGGPYGLAGDIKINGRRAISQVYRDSNSAYQAAVIFDLPATYKPSPVIASGFQNGRSPFTPQLGTFAVTTKAGGNRVYRQSSLAGQYRALVTNMDWEEQSIEADIRPTQGTQLDSGPGLAVRYLDDANYYSVTLNGSGYLALNRMRDGVFTTMTQKALPVVVGRNYHIGLQAYGSRVNVRVDGKEFLGWTDAQPVTHGSAALIGVGLVEYDNVVVAQVGQRPIFGLFYVGCDGPVTARNPEWTINGVGNWNCEDGDPDQIMQQTSTAGVARAIVGTPTDDQVITTRARATAFADNKDRWFGITTRYVDENNYYYLTVRNSNAVSLRKLVNGVITTLGTAPLTVTTNAWYDLRLDAVGNELRAFVNGTQVLQATDASHPSGQNGLVMYKAGAEYLDYFAWQP